VNWESAASSLNGVRGGAQEALEFTASLVTKKGIFISSIGLNYFDISIDF